MVGRLNISLLVACLILVTRPVRAQSGPWTGAPPAGGPYANNHWTGWNAAYWEQQPGGGGANGYCPQDSYCPQDAQTIAELLPEKRGPFHGDELPPLVTDAFRGAWFNVDYMLTDVRDPGNGLLGAPIGTVPNPREPFIITLPDGSISTARVLDVTQAGFTNVNGVRTNFGVPFTWCTFEGEFWGLQHSKSFITQNDIPTDSFINPLPAPQFIATSLLSSGAPAGLLVLYDAGFGATYAMSAWGAEANIYYNYRNPQLGWRFRPLLGFRYTQFDENLQQRGQFSNISGLSPLDPAINPPIDKHIDSAVSNSIYGVQTGFSTQFVHQYFTLGFDPKFTCAANRHEATVKTLNLRDSPFPPVIADGLVTSNASDTGFTRVVDLSVYAKIHLREWLNLRVGYDFIWMGGISRAPQSIYYNDLGTANPPAVVARNATTSVWLSGLYVGGEIVLP